MSKSTAKDAPLQAILLTDSFSPNFSFLEQSQAFFELAGFASIDYALEFLQRTQVEDIILAVTKNFSDVENHVKRKWHKHKKSFDIMLLNCTECHNMADVMRDVDKKSLIKSDFVLLHCGIVGNCDLKQAVSEHRARRLKDKNCVITLVYSTAPPDSKSRSLQSDLFLLSQNSTNRLLHYKRLDEENESSVKLNIETLLNSENVAAHFDLLDCQIAICSPQVPPLFSDNFDFEDRHDLIREILTNDEILGYSAYIHMLNNFLALNFTDFNTYLFANMRILERYTYPLVADGIISRGVDFSPYQWYRRNVYSKSGSSLARSSKLVKNVIIGERTKIEAGCEIENSVIGSDSVIGKNCTIKNCIVWHNAKIEESCQLDQSLICSQVTLGNGCKLEERCVISDRVKLNPKVNLPAGSTLSSKSIDSDFISSTKADLNWSHDALFILKTKQKNVQIWPKRQKMRQLFDQTLVEEDESGDYSSPDRNAKNIFEQTGTMQNEMAGLTLNHSAENAIASSAFDEADSESDSDESFYQVVFDILQRGLDEKIESVNLILEINCAKPTYNVSVEKFARLLTMAIIQLASANEFKTVGQVMKQFLPIMKNYFKSSDAQLFCLDELRQMTSKLDGLLKQMSNVLHFLYDGEVLDEEVILRWYEKLEPAIKKQVEPFVRWLQEADEESSGEED